MIKGGYYEGNTSTDRTFFNDFNVKNSVKTDNNDRIDFKRYMKYILENCNKAAGENRKNINEVNENLISNYSSLLEYNKIIKTNENYLFVDEDECFIFSTIYNRSPIKIYTFDHNFNILEKDTFNKLQLSDKKIQNNQYKSKYKDDLNFNILDNMQLYNLKLYNLNDDELENLNITDINKIKFMEVGISNGTFLPKFRQIYLSNENTSKYNKMLINTFFNDINDLTKIDNAVLTMMNTNTINVFLKLIHESKNNPIKKYIEDLKLTNKSDIDKIIKEGMKNKDVVTKITKLNTDVTELTDNLTKKSGKSQNPQQQGQTAQVEGQTVQVEQQTQEQPQQLGQEQMKKYVDDLKKILEDLTQINLTQINLTHIEPLARILSEHDGEYLKKIYDVFIKKINKLNDLINNNTSNINRNVNFDDCLKKLNEIINNYKALIDFMKNQIIIRNFYKTIYDKFSTELKNNLDKIAKYDAMIDLNKQINSLGNYLVIDYFKDYFNMLKNNLNEEINISLSEIKKILKTNNKTEQEINEFLKTHIKDIVELKTYCMELSINIDKFATQNKTIENQMKTLEEDRNTKLIDISDWDDALHNYESENFNLITEEIQYNKVLTELENELKYLDTQLYTKNSEKDIKNKELMSKLSELQIPMGKFNDLLKSLVDDNNIELKNKEEEINKKEEEISEIEENIKDIEENIKKIEKDKLNILTEIKKVIKIIDKIKADFQQNNINIQFCEKKTKELRDEIDSLNEEYKKQEDLLKINEDNLLSIKENFNKKITELSNTIKNLYDENPQHVDVNVLKKGKLILNINNYIDKITKLIGNDNDNERLKRYVEEFNQNMCFQNKYLDEVGFCNETIEYFVNDYVTNNEPDMVLIPIEYLHIELNDIKSFDETKNKWILGKKEKNNFIELTIQNINKTINLNLEHYKTEFIKKILKIFLCIYMVDKNCENENENENENEPFNKKFGLGIGTLILYTYIFKLFKTKLYANKRKILSSLLLDDQSQYIHFKNSLFDHTNEFEKNFAIDQPILNKMLTAILNDPFFINRDVVKLPIINFEEHKRYPTKYKYKNRYSLLKYLINIFNKKKFSGIDFKRIINKELSFDAIPDCVETTIRNFINYLIYDEDIKDINNTLLPKSVMEEVQNFYKKYNTIESQKSDESRLEWIKLFNYHIKPVIQKNVREDVFTNDVWNNRNFGHGDHFGDSKSNYINFTNILSIICKVDKFHDYKVENHNKILETLQQIIDKFNITNDNPVINFLEDGRTMQIVFKDADFDVYDGHSKYIEKQVDVIPNLELWKIIYFTYLLKNLDKFMNLNKIYKEFTKTINTGGENFYMKYLKYKQKYLNLRNSYK